MSTAISGMVGWGERRNKKGQRADFADANRVEILADCMNIGRRDTAERWGISRSTLDSVINRWRMAGYKVPEFPKHMRALKIERISYELRDNGCRRATKFQGSQSHCLECPFTDGCRQE